jgi:hypothetical protein
VVALFVLSQTAAADSDTNDETLAGVLGTLISGYESHHAVGLVRAGVSVVGNLSVPDSAALYEIAIATAEAKGALDPAGALGDMAAAAEGLGLGTALTEFAEAGAPPPDWDAIIAELLIDAQQYADPSVYFDVRAPDGPEVLVDPDGVVTGYTLTYSQWIDPEGGIRLYIVYTLNTDLEVTGVLVWI